LTIDKMNVLMLNYEFPPLGGGAGNATYYLLKEFSLYKGLSIDVVTSSVSKYRKKKFSDNIDIYFLDIGKKRNFHYQSNLNLLAYTIKSYFFCKKLMKMKAYDLCHAFFGIPCGFIAMESGLPYIVSLRGSDVPFYNERFYIFDKLFFRHLSAKIWQRAYRVIANSEGLKKFALKSIYGREIDVIYNGVDTEQFKRCYKNSDKIRVLCVSRLIPRKGIEHLIRAIKILQKHDITLDIVGEGCLESNLRRLVASLGISDKIEFTRFIEHDSIDKVYCRSNIFVLPSLNEGMSNAALEAMACGLPVVVTNTGGAIELVNGNGFIVNVGCPEEIASSLLKFLNNRGLIEEMGEKSRRIAETMGWNKVAKSYYDIYTSVVESHSGSSR